MIVKLYRSICMYLSTIHTTFTVSESPVITDSSYLTKTKEIFITFNQTVMKVTLVVVIVYSYM